VSLAVRDAASAVVAEALTSVTGPSEAVDLPGFAEQAASPAVLRAASLVIGHKSETSDAG